MIKRVHPLAIPWLVLMWILLWGDLSIGNLLAGLGLALFIVIALPLPEVPVHIRTIRWLKLAKLMVLFHRDLVVSSIRVAIIALRSRPQPAAAIIKLPFDIYDDLIFSFGVSLLNLQPGGTVTDIILQERTIVVHLLDGHSEAAIDREIKNVEKLQRDLLEVFPHAQVMDA